MTAQQYTANCMKCRNRDAPLTNVTERMSSGKTPRPYMTGNCVKCGTYLATFGRMGRPLKTHPRRRYADRVKPELVEPVLERLLPGAPCPRCSQRLETKIDEYGPYSWCIMCGFHRYHPNDLVNDRLQQVGTG